MDLKSGAVILEIILPDGTFKTFGLIEGMIEYHSQGGQWIVYEHKDYNKPLAIIPAGSYVRVL